MLLEALVLASTMCSDMEAKTLDHLYKTPACKAEFEATFAANDVPTTHAWMVERKECFKEYAHFSWIAYAANEMKWAELSWTQQLHMLTERIGDVDATLARGEEPIGPVSAAITNSFLDEVETNTAFKAKMEQALAGAEPLCLLHFNRECIEAMRTALNWMYPRSYKLSVDPPEAMTFSMVALTREVFTDSLTQTYAVRLARELLSAVRTGAWRDPSFEAFYPMALRHFEGDYDRLWKFIAIYATRGAAWASGYKMVGPDNQPLFAAMMIISSAMGYLDTAWYATGRAWSYATAAETTCFQPKPYHYWMSGAFAYLLRKEGYSSRTAKQVARLLGAMYEVGSTTMGRDPDRIFFVATFDPEANRARREVAHHALGSTAGLAHAAPPVPRFDVTLDRLLQASQPLPPYSEDEMRRKIQDAPTRWSLWTKLVGFYDTFGD